MTLDQVIARLSNRDVVDGLLTIGSASKDELTPASDYDLVLVLSDTPVPLHVALTTIDGRLADIIFVTVEQIDQVVALVEPVDGDDWIGRIVRWLAAGQIVFDRSGQLERAQHKVCTGDWLRATNEQDAYGACFKVNFNLAQTRRLLASDDPVYLSAGELRIALYGPSDLLFGYWEIRNMRWEGDKAAIRYLVTHDPTYLDLFRRFLKEQDLERRFEAYERLAEMTTAPLGGLWQDGVTALMFGVKTVPPDMIAAGLRFWEELISD
jgi:hypothetical protein